MSATLFSRDWYRLADLTPALRKHVRIHAHRYRGQRWYVLEDSITGENRRLSAQAYWLIGLMNGLRSVDQIWALASEKLGEEMPTHEELIQLISSLYQANALQVEGSGDVAELFTREHEAKKKKRLAKLKSPLSIQIPLVDPEKFVARTMDSVSPIFTKPAFLVWLLAVSFLLVTGLQNWGPLTEGVADQILAADNLLLLWLIYPIIKLLHELGHAYAVKRFGGEVHEMGVMLLVLIPVPYVDASASGAFANKYQRILVGAAGIMVELFIGALAMMVWLNAEPGLIKSMAYNVLVIAGVSTLLVNGNPLLRFDGYYVFADWLEIPNLSQKANQAWGWIVKHYAFKIPDLQRPGESTKEFAWLAFYGAAAFFYRIFLTITIVLFVSGKYFVVGVILAVWSFVGVWLWPSIKTISKAWTEPEMRKSRRNPSLVMTVLIGGFVVLVAILPFPLSTSVEGVVEFPERSRVLAKESCFVEWVRPANEQVPEAADLIICKNPQLDTTVKVLAGQLAQAKARRLGVWEDPVRLKLVDEEIRKLTSELEETLERQQNLVIKAASEGQWWVKTADDLPARFIRRGDLVGYVAGNQQRIKAMVPEQDIDLVRKKTNSVVMLSEATNWQPLDVPVWQLFPSATKQVPSEILVKNGGGQIVINPSASQPESIEPYFIALLEMPQGYQGKAQQRVYVKFEHAPEPLIFRFYRVVRRTFLEYFDA